MDNIYKIKLRCILAAVSALLVGSMAHCHAGDFHHTASAYAAQQQAPSDNATNISQYTLINLNYSVPTSAGSNTDLALLPLKINGSLVGTFLIDTGTTFSAVTDETAKELGLTLRPALTPEGKAVFSDGKPAQAVTLSSLKSADEKLNLYGDFAVISHSAFAMYPELKTINGIIGIDILSHFGVLWDFSHHQVTLVVPSTLSQEEIQALGFTGAGIALTRAKTNQLFYAPLSVTVGTATGQEQALIDTGSTFTDTSASFAGRLKMQPFGAAGKEGSILGFRDTFASLVSSIQLGDQTIDSPTLHFPARDTAWPPPKLGLDVFSRFRVLFDFQGGRMYLAPPSLLPRIQLSLPAPKLSL